MKRNSPQTLSKTLFGLLITISLQGVFTNAYALDRGLKVKYQEMKTEQRIALVIGNANYKDTPFSTLKTPSMMPEI